MDLTGFRILDALSRDPGKEESISGLVQRIKELGYKGYYKNIYDKVQDMKREGLLRVRKIGRVVLISLKLDDPRTIDELSIMEIERKRRLMKAYAEEEEFIQDLEVADNENLHCLAFMKPEKNIKLNAAEILYLMNSEKGMESLLKRVKKLAAKYNKAIYPLILTEKEFQRLLELREHNQAKELLKDKIVMVNPAGFWRIISQAKIIDVGERKLNPREIRKSALYYNLGRFGYSVFTNELKKEKPVKLEVETIIMACLMAEEARLREAVPILLSKNKVNHQILLFLAIKYRKINILGYLMEMTKNLIRNDKKKVVLDNALSLFELFRENSGEIKVKDSLAKKWGIEIRTTKKEIEEKMRLYNAI
jgi:hypothetical protein